MISTPITLLEKRANSWAKAFGAVAKVIDGFSTVGAGSIPGSTLPTKLVAIKPASKQNLLEIVRILRSQRPYVIGRIEKNTLLLDPRTTLPSQDAYLIKAIQSVL